MEVGQCDFPMFDNWMGFQHTQVKRTQRVYKETVNGVKKPNKKFYYSFPMGEVPSLNVKYDYALHDHGHLSGRSETKLHSRYTKLKFTIEQRTGRVTCRYERESIETHSDMCIA